jgi:hypothetical protein
MKTDEGGVRAKNDDRRSMCVSKNGDSREKHACMDG